MQEEWRMDVGVRGEEEKRTEAVVQYRGLTRRADCFQLGVRDSCCK